MSFDFARREDAPGLPAAAPLRADRLALAMRDTQVRRRNPWPERAMRCITVAFWAALGFSVAAAILVLS